MVSRDGRLAQLAEHRPYKPTVVGSSPTAPTPRRLDVVVSGRHLEVKLVLGRSAVAIADVETWQVAEVPLADLFGWVASSTLRQLMAPILSAALRRDESRRRVMRQSQRSRILRRDRRICHYCHRAGDDRRGPDGRSWQIDHKTPWSGGGQDVDSNLVLACASCNRRKGATPYEEFHRGP